MEVWLRFLIGEMSLGDKESALRRALDSLVRGLTGKGWPRIAGRMR
jgi:hypothetical protein